MRTLAVLAVVFLFACGEPHSETAESGVHDSTVPAPATSGSQTVGVYRMASLDGQPLPSRGISSGFMEFRSDSTWGLSVSYTDLSTPVISSGRFSVGEIKERCVEVVTWPDGLTDHEDTLNVCDGVYALESGSWIATFEKDW